jgi:hypothetical protein
MNTPTTKLVCDDSPRLATKSHAYLFARFGISPEMNGQIALNNHMVVQ